MQNGALPASALTASTVAFLELLRDGDDVFWVELRPDEGRAVLAAAEGLVAGEVPGGVGSRVHEYGGGAATVADGIIYWVDHLSQRIWGQAVGSEPVPLVPADGRRYADVQVDRLRSRLIAVCEDHRQPGEPENLLVQLPISGGDPLPLVRGRDFYVSPRISPDGNRLAYACWDHPWMPWDAAEVRLAELNGDGAVAADRHLAGGRDGSAGAPQWSPDGLLHMTVERDGWWNLHVADAADDVAVVITEPADHGYARLGGHDYDVDAAHVVVVSRSQDGGRLKVLDRASGRLRQLDVPLTDVGQPRLAGGEVVFIGGSASSPLAIWSVPVSGGDATLLRPAGGAEIDPALLAEPERLRAPGRDGHVVHGFFYRPRPAAERPAPLVVHVHGGPVAGLGTALQFGVYAATAAVYWTSRGYGYLDVAYRGTTGFGRAYREALYGRWGEAEVSDVLDAVQHLAGRGDIDPARVAIRGGSAGGWTVLAAATAAPDSFAAGTAYFPVSDLVAFARSTHKYESHYLERLVGPYDADAYRDRSPLSHVDRVRAPLLFLQGDEDHVCPPDQSSEFVDALRGLGRTAEYRLFQGEGHGFVRAESIVESLEREAAFYAQHLRP
jgi:dipeptidyl aminopeptidase/acylaminoacyl peptidase